MGLSNRDLSLIYYSTSGLKVSRLPNKLFNIFNLRELHSSFLINETSMLGSIWIADLRTMAFQEMSCKVQGISLIHLAQITSKGTNLRLKGMIFQDVLANSLGTDLRFVAEGTDATKMELESYFLVYLLITLSLVLSNVPLRHVLRAKMLMEFGCEFLHQVTR